MRSMQCQGKKGNHKKDLYIRFQEPSCKIQKTILPSKLSRY
jgi:hypothetical protein